MNKIKYILFFFPFLIYSQDLLKGEIANSGDVEGIHVFNKTASQYTITNQKGGFEIQSKVGDTIVFSAIQYQLKTLIVSKENLENKVYVVLEEQLNELDVVYIRPKLSGDLSEDSKKIKTKSQLTAKSLSLPNAEVIPPTQAERRLQTASDFKAALRQGAIALDPIINAISGRTKRLKEIVEKEKKMKLEGVLEQEFKNVIINDYKVPEDNFYEFIYFISSDKLFNQIVNSNSNLIIQEFLKNKAEAFLKVLKVDK